MSRRPPCWMLVAALAASVPALACADDDENDPLDAALLADLARAVGDKAGEEWSGEYRGPATPISCDCPTVELDLDVGTDESTVVDLCLLSIGDLDLEVVQGGGAIAVSGALSLSGAIADDDSVVLAAVADYSEPYGHIEVFERFDGAFSGDSMAAFMSGRHQRRYVASIVGSSLDCRVTHDLMLER